MGELFIIISTIILAAGVLWSYSLMLNAALGISKWSVLLVLIPLINIVMIISWGIEAYNRTKKEEFFVDWN